MKNTIRKGAKVRYIGKSPEAAGKIFTVKKKTGSFVEIMFPCRYLDGSIHGSLTSIPLTDVEIAE